MRSSRHRSSVRRALVLVPAAAAVGLSGCAGGVMPPGEPAARLVGAVEQAQAQQGVRTTVRLETTPEDIRTLLALEGGGPSQGMDALVEETLAELLPKARLVSEARSTGRPLAEETDPTRIDQRVAVSIGDPSIELTKVGNDAFVRADVEGLGRESGLFTRQQAALLAGGLQDADWLSDLIDGRWVGLGLESVLPQQGAQSLTGRSVDAARQQRMLTRLQQELATTAKVTEGERTDLGQELRLEVPVREGVKALEKAVAQAYPEEKHEALAPKDLQTLRPEATMTLDTVVDDDDRLRRVTFDLAQVRAWGDAEAMTPQARKDYERLAQADFALTVITDIEEAGDIARPSDARMLTQRELDALTKDATDAAGPR